MYLLDRIMNRLEDSKFGQHDEIEISLLRTYGVQTPTSFIEIEPMNE